MKKIKYTSKVSMTPPPPDIDEVDIETIEIDFLRGTVEIGIRAIDNEGGTDKNGNPRPEIKEKRPIHMGLETFAAHVNIEKLENETLDAVEESGVLPTGGNRE